MSGLGRRPCLLLLLAASALGATRRPAVTVSRPTPPTPPPAIPVARVSVASGAAEWLQTGGDWRPVDAAYRMKTGDRLRTGPSAVARVEFPWMAVTAGPATTLSIPAVLVLSTILEQGRAELGAESGEIIKLRTAEGEVRGSGRVIVRRQDGATLVSVREGSFRVDAGGRSLTLRRGEGAIVRPGRPAAVVPLSAPPARLRPGLDPLYVLQGKPVTLSWTSAATAYHVQVLSVDSDEILIERDVDASPVPFAIPWLGTYRWRVALRDELGIEGMPSSPGLFCVVEK